MRFCPRDECSAVIDKPLFCHKHKVDCNSCSIESYMRCGGGYHRVRLCRCDDKRYSKWLRSHEVRACPGCKTDIEKQSGCLHMNCVRCDQEFCWACLRPWSGHNFKLCTPIASIHKRGGLGPLQLAAKGVLVGVAGVVIVSVAGVIVVTAVAVPPAYAYVRARDSLRDHKKRRLEDSDFSDDVVTQSTRLRISDLRILGFRRHR